MKKIVAFLLTFIPLCFSTAGTVSASLSYKGYKQIAVAPSGDLWTLDSKGNLFENGTQDKTISDCTGIAAGGTKDNMVTVCLDDKGNIFQKTGNTWLQLDGTLAQIAVSEIGELVGVNQHGEIYYAHNANGKNTKWKQIPGQALWVSLGGGVMWCVNSTRNIYRAKLKDLLLYPGLCWPLMTGQASQISVASDGTAYILSVVVAGIEKTPLTQNPEGTLSHWSSQTNEWDPLDTKTLGSNITAGATGVYLLGSNGQPYQWKLSGWVSLSGSSPVE